MSKTIDRELKSMIKFIEFLKKEDVDPNEKNIKEIIKSTLKICYLQGKIDLSRKRSKVKI